jgi:hypothetical protein
LQAKDTAKADPARADPGYGEVCAALMIEANDAIGALKARTPVMLDEEGLAEVAEVPPPSPALGILWNRVTTTDSKWRHQSDDTTPCPS